MFDNEHYLFSYQILMINAFFSPNLLVTFIHIHFLYLNKLSQHILDGKAKNSHFSYKMVIFFILKYMNQLKSTKNFKLRCALSSITLNKNHITLRKVNDYDILKMTGISVRYAKSLCIKSCDVR